jgi:hypothetical protein
MGKNGFSDAEFCQPLEEPELGKYQEVDVGGGN